MTRSGTVRALCVKEQGRIIASNWIVEDQAATVLVSRFPEGLAHTLSANEAFDPAEAFHAAKLSLRKQSKWGEPYYRTSMVYVGSAPAIVVSRSVLLSIRPSRKSPV